MKNIGKVSQFHNKNQFVIDLGSKRIFQSYDSTIAVLESDKITLGCNWNYSTTTSKHLYMFLEEYLNIAYHSSIKYGLAEHSKNKRKYIQKLIDEGIIEYDNNLV